MKIDGFLEIGDIPGASERAGHEDQMEVHGVEFNMEAPRDANSLSRRGRVSLSMITFTKYYDKGSPYLKKAVFDNTVFDEVKFSARRTIEGETSDYLVVTLKKASVLHYQMKQAEDAEDLIEERVGFSYQTITFNYGDSDEVEMDVRVGM